MYSFLLHFTFLMANHTQKQLQSLAIKSSDGYNMLLFRRFPLLLYIALKNTNESRLIPIT